MKKLIFGVLFSALLFSGISMAGEDAKTKWMNFQKQQREAQMAFSKKQQEDREQYLKTNKDVADYLDQEKKASRERSGKMMEEHRKKVESNRAEMKKSPQPPAAK